MRQTYSDRFKNILSSSNLSKRDREFIESLKSQYTKKNRLSSGQAKWFAKLEEKYAKLATGVSLGDPHTTSRLAALSTLVTPDTWEAGFVESLAQQNDMGRKLSEKQLQALRKIEANHTVDARQERQEWFSNYDDTHREIAQVCAKYYSTTPYYQDLVKKVLDNSKFIPTQKQWEAMCQNKYAQKLIKIHESKPKFDNQSVVQLRKSSDVYKRSSPVNRQGKPGFIIQTDIRTPDPIAGGRWYSVLFAGETTPVQLREKDIKTMK